MNKQVILGLIEKEAERGLSIHGFLNSRHEGYAVIKEEFDELWDAIKGNCSNEMIVEEAVLNWSYDPKILTRTVLI